MMLMRYARSLRALSRVTRAKGERLYAAQRAAMLMPDV